LELDRILADREMRDCLLMVFANKQDLPGCECFSFSMMLGGGSAISRPSSAVRTRVYRWTKSPHLSSIHEGDGKVPVCHRRRLTTIPHGVDYRQMSIASIHQSISITALTRSDVTRRGYREAWSAQDEGTVVVCAPKVSQSNSYWNLADCKLRNHRGGSL